MSGSGLRLTIACELYGPCSGSELKSVSALYTVSGGTVMGLVGVELSGVE